MSWDIWLTCDCCGYALVDLNYTHNVNGMLRDAAEAGGLLIDVWSRDGWEGLPGPVGALRLDVIIKELEANPAKYEAMNPPNGWGSYETVLPVLREMRDGVPESPTTWHASF